VRDGREDIKAAIGARLKRAAKEAGLDATAVSEKIGVSVQTIYNWWKGSRQPDLVDLQKYAEAVGKEEGWFFDPERRRVAQADDFAVRLVWLAMEGMDFGQAYDSVTNGNGSLSPRERRMISAGTEAVKAYISQQWDWSALSAEDRVRLLRQVVEAVHQKE
jgi:transcriptional regulator with XRE-family HTH domain